MQKRPYWRSTKCFILFHIEDVGPQEEVFDGVQTKVRLLFSIFGKARMGILVNLSQKEKLSSTSIVVLMVINSELNET